LGLNELARRAEIGPGYLSEVERGRKRPSVSLLIRVGRVLNLKTLTLLDRVWPESRMNTEGER
jgi:transcriptional regulator with XRE-family HTH domain